MVGGVSVMKGNDLKFKEIEVSHTLGGSGEGRVKGRGNWRECRYSGVKHVCCLLLIDKARSKDKTCI